MLRLWLLFHDRFWPVPGQKQASVISHFSEGLPSNSSTASPALLRGAFLPGTRRRLLRVLPASSSLVSFTFFTFSVATFSFFTLSFLTFSFLTAGPFKANSFSLFVGSWLARGANAGAETAPVGPTCEGAGKGEQAKSRRRDAKIRSIAACPATTMRP